ncbi:DgyrCDS11632 [Dimorphilus gyrociliatus]|uniref:V-type proton ATPase subunit a n=1 Tax=Dimorphilus gyrociliatus TaxID=2664684 RepID=A0A7I8W3Y1_9ANNE|nr:DgyrCDS11632 [Dimorphilus gyrociliatus]
MGSLYRSEEMTLCQLFLQSEAAYACVSELGELGLVQFRDLNPDVSAFQRKFVNEVRRCDEMERKLRFLEKELEKDNIPQLDTGDLPEAPAPREMIDLEATFEKLENEMKEVNSNAEALKRNYLELTELKHILRKTQGFFEEAMTDPNMAEETVGLLGEEVRAPTTGQQPLRLGFVAGVIVRERMPAFERMLWRACRGNVFLKQANMDVPLEDPVTGDQVHKSVFIIFFQGDQLKTRVKKICEGFRATLYPCPETPAERREMAIGVMTRIEDLNTVLQQTRDHRHRVLVAAAKNMRSWLIKVRKIKAIYMTLNLFNLDVTQKCLIAECWCPVADLDRIQLGLRRGTEASGSSVPSILNRMATRESPPTYNRTNKFTSGFQSIVDAYGVAVYREVNPAPFTIITFPFLFAVMFGDFGHGLIMLCFAIWMILRERQLIAKKAHEDEMFGMFFSGRYMIMLMGIFSMYTGFVYNDFFSKSVNVFGSGWTVNDFTNSTGTRALDPNTTEWSGSPYWYGMDPVWQMSLNKISFLNTFKMKTSVILGIIHMFSGVILSLSNHRYFGNTLNIFCEFIPQVLFLSAIFLYLVCIIMAKWIYITPADSACAPSLLIGLINMVMFKYQKLDKNKTLCAVVPWYPGQQGLESFLVILAGLCIPWHLCLKPILLYMKHKGKFDFEEAISQWTGGRIGKRDQAHLSVNSGDLVTGDNVEMSGEHDEQMNNEETVEKEFELGDILVHQAIHSIEYFLNCVSHTASYLRLWALSLAHAQLSEVLWSMVLRMGFSMIPGYAGAIMLSAIFPTFALLTVGVLLIMEGLSAFLHALRLHWIEFQSKFYQGAGHLFVPFSFEAILEITSTNLEG